ncbi:MAG: hypothetical protein AMXMBFR47_34900 [Planctomycetota bacterium]
MNVARVAEPGRYRGLYVFDFGEWTAVGYTAEEVAILLEDPRYRDGKVYRIQRATPDGGFELRGVSSDRWQLESGMFFYRDTLGEARDDYVRLVELAETTDFPARGYAHLTDRTGAQPFKRYLTALVFPSEYDDDISAWLHDHGYAGGATVEGGISHVTNYLQEQKVILARRQLWSRASRTARAADEVLSGVRMAVQR